MTTALLILATQFHENVQFNVDWFGACDVKCFVHVDKKWPISPFKKIANAQILLDQIDVFWGGFSMIRAEVALMEKAQSAGPFDRYILLSDDSLPLARAETILQSLKSDKEYISCTPASGNIRDRYDKFFHLDHPALNPKYSPISDRGITSENYHSISELLHSIEKGKDNSKTIFYGPQWWALTDRSISLFLASYKKNASLRNSFRWSAIPDEQYVQTVIGNSNAGDDLLPSPMYVDFSRSPKPYVFTDDISLPLSSGKFFFRKALATNASLVEILRSL